jgi:DNA sulfur modification protein DndE
MAIDTVRIDEQGRERLIWLKRNTRIETFNVLCRWALCLSLAEATRPPARRFKGEAVDIAWRVFGGAYADLYLGLVKARCRHDGLPTDDQTVQEQFRLHVHRGLGYLAADQKLRSIGSLARRVDAHRPAA